MIIFEQSHGRRSAGRLHGRCAPARKFPVSQTEFPIFAAGQSRIGRTCASTKNVQHFGQRVEFLGSAISPALELCARVLVRFTLISARASAGDSFGLAASAAKVRVISATALLESTAQLETMSRTCAPA